VSGRPDRGAIVPLHLLTGFLGSGKTTLLAALVERARDERIVALVHDVADLPLDPWLLERVDEDVWSLPSGCLCCSLRGELYEALERVAALRPSRVVLETSGLADPAPILHGLAADARLAARVRPAGVVAVVDALRAEDLLATQPELRRQLAFADRIVLTKTDLAPERAGPVEELLAREAPGCEVRRTPNGQVDPGWLLDAPALARLRGPDEASSWLHHGPREGSVGADPTAFVTRTVESESPVDLAPVELWLRLVTQLDGPRLLRVKILLEERASGACYALQSAGRLVAPPRRLAPGRGPTRGLRMVLVARGLAPAVLDRLLESFRAALRGEPRSVA